MNGLIKTRELAEVLSTTKKQLLERARAEKWPSVSVGNALFFPENRLPLDVRFKLASRRGGEVASADSTEELSGSAFMKAGEKARQTAVWRSALVSEFQGSGLKVQDFVQAYNAGACCTTLHEKLGDVSVTTLYRWIADFKKHGSSGVTPKYGMNRGGAGESLTDTERDNLAFFWLKSTQPSAMHAFRLMKENVPYSKCTYQTALRYLNSIPAVIRDFYRIGKSRWENAYLPFVEQDIDMYRAMDCIVSDHHCLDCVCMYQGKLIRPWITTFQDYRSGKVLGWCPTVKPSSYSIIVAFYMAVLQYGVPKTALFDNGQDYHSKLLNGYRTTAQQLLPDGMTEEVEVEFQGIFNLIGTEVHFTRVYNGKSKGRQERYFRILGEYLAKDFGTYVGSDSRTRPEEAQLMWRGINGMEKRDDIPDWSDFVVACNNMVQWINDKFECSGKGMEGKTRSEVFQKQLPPEGVRRISKEELAKALYFPEVRKCGRNGVKVNGVNYWSEELIQFSGQQVRIHASLVNDTTIQVYTLKGEFICEALGNFFKESERLEDTIKRVTDARNKGLQLIAEKGLNETHIDPEKKSFIDVTARAYDNTKILSVDEQLALPQAVGAEWVEEPEKPARKAKHKYTDELDADPEDYL